MPRVLVVDDSVVMRDIVRAHLSGLGLDLEFASSAEDGLSRIAVNAPYDLIVTDYAMPGINGLEFARRVKDKGGITPPRIILISANKELRERELLSTGVLDAFFPKPLDGVQLAARVSSLLSLTTASPTLIPSSKRTRPVIRIVIADERDSASEGMQIAALHSVERAPFFVVENGHETRIYDVYFRFVNDVMKAKSSDVEAARDLLHQNPDLDFI